MTAFNTSYNKRKGSWNQLPDISTLNEAELIESVMVHLYYTNISKKHIKSFNITKLVDFIPTNLKNTDDYLKALDKFVRYVHI